MFKQNISVVQQTAHAGPTFWLIRWKEKKKKHLPFDDTKKWGLINQIARITRYDNARKLTFHDEATKYTAYGTKLIKQKSVNWDLFNNPIIVCFGIFFL